DGTETFYDIVRVYNDHFRASMDVTIYPNPATNENLHLRIQTGDDHTPINIRVFDLKGKVHYSRTMNSSLNMDEQILPDERMIPGVYFMVIQQGDDTKKKKIVIR
ncbi:MAG: T9SS type A sorting domain-containing protein, partial [Ekhidna sp.]